MEFSRQVWLEYGHRGDVAVRHDLKYEFFISEAVGRTEGIVLRGSVEDDRLGARRDDVLFDAGPLCLKSDINSFLRPTWLLSDHQRNEELAPVVHVKIVMVGIIAVEDQLLYSVRARIKKNVNSVVGVIEKVIGVVLARLKVFWTMDPHFVLILVMHLVG